MALQMAAASRRLNPTEKAAAEGEEDVRRRNRELEEEVRRSREREEEARRELEKTRERLRVAEAAEERLCAQLGDLEAEGVVEARAYLLQIRSLMEQLAGARQLHHRRAVPPPRPLVAEETR